MKFYLTGIVAFFLLICISCSLRHTPKPTGYNRIDIDVVSDRKFQLPRFSFMYPDQVRIDTLKKMDDGAVWFNIVYPPYAAIVHCTYLPITSTSLPELIEDSYHLAYSHTIKADGIDQQLFHNPKTKVHGILYEIEGEVATPIQFFVTDSVRYFLRGSFYYENKVNPDSVASVTEYIKGNIENMIQTLEWN